MKNGVFWFEGVVVVPCSHHLLVIGNSFENLFSKATEKGPPYKLRRNRHHGRRSAGRHHRQSHTRENNTETIFSRLYFVTILRHIIMTHQQPATATSTKAFFSRMRQRRRETEMSEVAQPLTTTPVLKNLEGEPLSSCRLCLVHCQGPCIDVCRPGWWCPGLYTARAFVTRVSCARG